MADGKVIIDTQLNSKGAEQGVSKLKKSLTGIGSVAKMGLGVATKAIGAAGTAVTAFGGYAVKAGMSFEAGMSKVKAISGEVSKKDLPGIIAKAKEMGLAYQEGANATETAFNILSAKAKEMGAKTKFSAAEASSAFEFMSMAGWKAGDMLNGIEGIMNLAAASGEDLASTSDIVTDALTAFGMTAADSSHFADVLAQASSNANTNVGLMGETFKYVAPVAGALKYSAEDTAVAIGLMANSGIKASSAGTALRSLFTNLAKPTKSVQVAMDALNISLTDSKGKMKPLNKLMVDMRKKFAGLTEEQKAQYAASLAGKTGMSGLLAIVNASDKDFKKLTKSINNADGAAERMADTMQKNLTGQITILKSAVEGLAIEIYEGFSEKATEFVKSGTGIISNIVTGLQNGDKTAVSTGINDLMSLIINGIVQAAPSVINAAVEIMAALANGLISNTDGILNAIKEVVSNIGTKLSENTDAIVSGLTNMITKAVDFVSANLPDMVSFAVGFIGKLVTALITNLPDLISSLVNLVGSAVEALVSNLPDFATAAGEIIKGLGNAILDGMGKLGEVINKLVEGAFQTLKDVAPWTRPLVEGLSKAWESIQDAWKGATDFFKNIFSNTQKNGTSAFSAIESIITKAWSAIEEVWDACAPFFEKTFSAVGSIVSDVFHVIRTVAKTALSAIRPMVQKLQPLFESVFGAAEAVAQVVFPAILSIISGIFSKISAIVNTFRPLVEGVFRGAFIAVQTIWNVAVDLFTGIFNAIKGIFSAIKSIWTGDFEGAWESIKGVFSDAAKTFFDIGKDLIQGLVNGVKNMVGTAVEAVKNVGKNIINGAKNILGIHSPSREFKKLGEYTMKGFSDGLNEFGDKAVKTTVSIARKVVGNAQDAVEKTKKKYEDLVKSYNNVISEGKKRADKIAELEKKAAKQSVEDRKKTNKEIEKLEKEQTELLAKEEKLRTQVKKAEQEAQKAASKEFYVNQAADLLSYYEEINKQPSLVDTIKEQAAKLEEEYQKMEDEHKNMLSDIKTSETNALKELKSNYETHYNEVNKLWEDKLSDLKNTYEKKMSEIAAEQEKLYTSTLNFTGLFDEVKDKDVINAEGILANAEAQTAKVNKFSENLEKIKNMNLPDEIKQQFADMGVEAADQLEIFVNMSAEQVQKFVDLWKQRNEVSKKLSQDWYADQAETATTEYEKQKKIYEEQQKEELDRITKEYEERKATVKNAFKGFTATAIKNYEDHMKQLRAKATQEANQIANSIKNAMLAGTKVSTAEAEKFASKMTESLLGGIKATAGTDTEEKDSKKKKSSKKSSAATDDTLATLNVSYQKKLAEVKDTQEKELAQLEKNYKSHYDSVDKIWNDRLDSLKKAFEKKMSEIKTSQEKLLKSLEEAWSALKTPDMSKALGVDGEGDITASHMARIETFAKKMKEVIEQNLPGQLVDQFKDMGEVMSAEFGIFDTMSGGQMDEFIETWKSKRYQVQKLSTEYYTQIMDNMKIQYDLQKEELNKEREDELKNIIRHYEEKRRLLEDQHTQNLADVKRQYRELTATTISAYNSYFYAMLSRYQDSMRRLQQECREQGRQIVISIREGLMSGAYLTEEESEELTKKLTAGILSAVSDTLSEGAKAAAKDMSESLIKTVEANLEIHSPSKVFKRIGDYCVEGLRQPFENLSLTKTIKPAINEVMNEVKNAGMTIEATTGQAMGNTTYAPTMNFYDSAVSPDAVYRQINKTMRYGLAGGLA